MMFYLGKGSSGCIPFGIFSIESIRFHYYFIIYPFVVVVLQVILEQSFGNSNWREIIAKAVSASFGIFDYTFFFYAPAEVNCAI